MQAIADQEHRSLSIEPWDYHYYMEKVRKDRFDFDQNELKPYLELDKLREGMFFVAEKVFGLKFIPVKDVPVFHPDVQVWKVQNIAKNTTVGLWYFDPFARKNKVSGAWMNAIRDQDRMDSAVTTIVTNNSNFMKGRPGEPVLISWDDAVTLFHEFGHALHGLSSNVTYPSLSGTNVLQDYVEFPSQLLERWLSTPEVRTKYMTHYKTGAPMPQSLVEKLEKASTFKQGYATVEYLSSALVDMKLHLLTETDVDPGVYEKETLKTLGMPREIVMRHRTPQFLHIFSSDEYSAGYYSYIWAEVITADAWDAFTEAGSGFDKTVSERLRNYVFSVGNTIDPTEAYRKFRGRDPEVRALMEKRGFTAD
jgi:peptidyl-dipeptidase Dcp